MAKVALRYFLVSLTLSLAAAAAASPKAVPQSSASSTFSMASLSEGRKVEKLTVLHFYSTDVFGGANRTAVPVTTILDNSTFYGGLFMADDPLTLGPEPNSTLVGRGRGIYSFPSQNDFVLEEMYSLAFTYGEYNGSTLSMLGSIHPTSLLSELSIVGGTGVFRFGRGYAVAKRVVLDFKALLVVREFNVYVSHY